MEVTERKTKDVRREEILGAAMEVFAQRGYEGASTDEIARLAGISQPYVFRLFGTKKELFTVTLDNLVVTTALPVIRRDLHSGLSGLEWTVNAYTLTFAVLLLTGAALGDRFGRRLLFTIGI